MTRSSRTLATRCTMLVLGAAFLLLPGCGPSKHELMMRSASRARSIDDDDEKKDEDKDEKPKPAPAKTEVAADQPKADSQPATNPTQQSPSAPAPAAEPQATVATDPVTTDPATSDPATTDSASAPPADQDKMADAEPADPQFLTIEQRKPTEPLSDDDRRQRAHDNLSAVSKALLAYVNAKKRFPPTYSEANGFKTLSWRVEILPYLGHEALYKKFDQSVPWNQSPNKELLEFIPDEYVSPERFDTSTNILMPARDGMIGGERGRTRPELVEDGLANTLMVVEVNDRNSVPWSAPQDYEPESPGFCRTGLLGLRKDGAFAVWANGWTVLMAKDLGPKFFWDAMTIDSGDGLKAGRVHRDIPLKQVSEASVASVEEAPVVEPDALPEMQPPPVSEVVGVREEVPSGGELAKVQSRFRGLFSKKIEEAKKDEDKSVLARELLEKAARMPEDPVGAYALQTAAMRVAIDGGDIAELIAGIDQRVGQFEVDAYKENRDWMIAFGRGVTQRDVETIDGNAYVQRAVKVIYAGIMDDDYVNASALGRYSFRMIDQDRGEDIPKYLTQLRGLLGAAKREFSAAGEALSDFRLDPNDGEAAATVGRFLCFVKGDWQRGLPLLTEGGPEELREIARRDLNGAAEYRNKTVLGDMWWDLSEKARSGLYRQSARDRAVYWYEQAFPVMPDSLDRLHVKSRLDEAEDAPPASPLAVIDKLAAELGVDLRVGLAAVGVVSRADNDDEDDEDD